MHSHAGDLLKMIGQVEKINQVEAPRKRDDEVKVRVDRVTPPRNGPEDLGIGPTVMGDRRQYLGAMRRQGF